MNYLVISFSILVTHNMKYSYLDVVASCCTANFAVEKEQSNQLTTPFPHILLQFLQCKHHRTFWFIRSIPVCDKKLHLLSSHMTDRFLPSKEPNSLRQFPSNLPESIRPPIRIQPLLSIKSTRPPLKPDPAAPGPQLHKYPSSYFHSGTNLTLLSLKSSSALWNFGASAMGGQAGVCVSVDRVLVEFCDDFFQIVHEVL